MGSRKWPDRFRRQAGVDVAGRLCASGCALAEGEQCACHAVSGVTDYVLFAGEVAGDAADAKFLNAIDIDLDGRRMLGSITCERLGREGSGVENGVVEDGRAGV